jgi:eukaryotic-like serine/threonine-protein kinase
MLETLGQYKVLDRLSAGGFGELYRARDTRVGRTVAIAVIGADIAKYPIRRGRFLEDARAAAALSHPNIASLYEIVEGEGELFLVTEFVQGQTLKQAVGGRPLNPRRAVEVAIQIADALAEAHAAGIVHRDLSCDTIILTPKGNAKILDFGLASWTLSGAQREPASILAAFKDGAPGVAAYLSPEQALGERVDQRTDIFSLGIISFEMLTGRLPFSGSTSAELALQIAQAEAPAPTALNPALPREVDGIVARALSKSLERRYEVAATVAADLRSVAAILEVRAEASGPVSLPVSGGRRSGVTRALVVVAILVLLGAVAWWQRAAVIRAWRGAFDPAPASRTEPDFFSSSPSPERVVFSGPLDFPEQA